MSEPSEENESCSSSDLSNEEKESFSSPHSLDTGPPREINKPRRMSEPYSCSSEDE